MALPEQLLLSDLLRRRVRCDQGLDHGPGVLAWMHPPVHRLLGWASRPSTFGTVRRVWRLDQLRGLSEAEVFVQGEPAESDAATLERLPTLFEATLVGLREQSLGRLVDAAVDLRSGAIRHYLIARSDPRLPGSSRWRLMPDRIVDQQPGLVRTALRDLEDLPWPAPACGRSWCAAPAAGRSSWRRRRAAGAISSSRRESASRGGWRAGWRSPRGRAGGAAGAHPRWLPPGPCGGSEDVWDRWDSPADPPPPRYRGDRDRGEDPWI